MRGLAVIIGVLLSILASAQMPFPRMHYIDPPATYRSSEVLSLSYDGTVAIIKMEAQFPDPDLYYLWQEDGGLTPLPTTPLGQFTPHAISGDGNVIVGTASTGAVAWKRSTNQFFTILTRLDKFCLSYDGSLIYAAFRQPFGSVTHTHLFRWELFGSAYSVVNFGQATIEQICGNSLATTLALDIYHTDVGFRFWKYSPAEGAVIVSPSDRPIHLSANGGHAILDAPSVRFQMSNGATVPIDVNFFQLSAISFNGNLITAENDVWRTDLGTRPLDDFLRDFYPDAEVDALGDFQFDRTDRLQHPMSADATTFALRRTTGPDQYTNYAAVIARNPDTFRRKMGERFAVTVSYRIRGKRFPVEPGLDTDDPSNSASYYETFYSLSNSTLLNPATQSRSSLSPLSVGYSGSIAFTTTANVAYLFATPPNLTLTGSLTDSDSPLPNDLLLSGPFSLTLADLRAGGKTFIGPNANLIITATYLGPILQNST